MSELAAAILEQSRALWGLEGIAVAAAIAYLLLAIRQNIACWLFAGISTAIFVYLFFEARLYMDSALNVFYVGMAIYGWTVWHRGRREDHALAVSTWPLRRHLRATATIAVMSGVSGYLLATFTDAEFPYVDSLTTWSSIWATFLVARKVLENWWYWLLIDAASTVIYWFRDLELTAMLFMVYVIMIPFGLVSWRRSMRSQVVTA
jgi:nicotinamide mononucleotide transporter